MGSRRKILRLLGKMVTLQMKQNEEHREMLGLIPSFEKEKIFLAELQKIQEENEKKLKELLAKIQREMA